MGLFLGFQRFQLMAKMKEKLLLFLCLLPFFCCAQTNAVKGMILGYPKAYFMGAAYEKSIKGNLSAQISWLHYGFDQRNTDGPAEHTHVFTPEIRYYLGKESVFIDQFFVGIFIELSKTEILPSGEQSPIYFLVAGESKQISPGILVGRNVNITDRFYVEIFFGGKYRFFSTERTFSNNQKEEIVVKNGSQPGLRVGIFLGYAF